MTKYILIFDHGEQVGFEKIESNVKGDIVTEVVKADINGQEVDVLHLLDMDYGIIIPAHIADKLRGID